MPRLIKTRMDKDGTITSIGRNGAGATLLRTKTGAEIQAGVGKLHVDAGFDKKNKSFGAGVAYGKKRVSFHKKFK